MQSHICLFKSAIWIALLASLLYVAVEGNSIQKAQEEELKSQVPKVFDYGSYVEKFKKTYSPLETLHRAKLFFGRTLKIFQHNVLYTQKKVSYFLTQNTFTDMTASEFKQLRMNKEHELAPVKEALTNPDLPADRLASVRRLKGEPEEEFSQASLDDLENNAKYDSKSHKVKPVLSFMDNQNGVDMKVVLQQIKDMPDVAAKAAEMIDMKDISDAKIESMLEEELGLSENQKNYVEYKPVVKSNNKNYEPQVTLSQASAEPKKTGANYAKFLMTDPNFEVNFAPYSLPDENDDEEEEPSLNAGSNMMSKFMTSVKDVASYLLFTDDDKEVYDENETELVTEEPTVKASSDDKPVVKYNIDWRITGCISPVQDQSLTCDSCYAFSVLSLMEYYHCRQTNQLTSFSAQYIVDCGSKVNLNGCRSSRVGNVGLFIKNYGLELNAKYPYHAKESSCPYNFDDSADQEKSGYLRPRISHWQNFQEMTAWYKWLSKFPLIVGINMPGDFLGYGGGVHDGLDCVTDMTHAMLLVGSGIQDGKEFWLLKNSFSESWGDEGYFKLAKHAPLRCFNSAIVARAKFTETANKPTATN